MTQIRVLRHWTAAAKHVLKSFPPLVSIVTEILQISIQIYSLGCLLVVCLIAWNLSFKNYPQVIAKWVCHVKMQSMHWLSEERGIFAQTSVVSSTQESRQKKERMPSHSGRHPCWCQGLSSPDDLKFPFRTVRSSGSHDFHCWPHRRRTKPSTLC